HFPYRPSGGGAAPRSGMTASYVCYNCACQVARMATRRETRSRLDRLSRDLLDLRRRAGGSRAPLPPVRALAETYGLSVALVRRELGRLQELGVVHSVPRVGTFLGSPLPDADEALIVVAAP